MTSSQARVRDGTALRKRGKNRVNDILRATRTLFLNEGYVGLSLRKVAELAGISLGNLTYYFSSKADLFESMIDDVLAEYGQRGEQILEEHNDNPARQLEAYMSFLFADTRRAETQQFFYQFWAVASHDPFVATARERAYADFHAQLEAFCHELNPGLDRRTLRQRIYLLMALVEGLHVVFGNSENPDADLDRLEPEFKKQVLNIIGSD